MCLALQPCRHTHTHTYTYIRILYRRFLLGIFQGFYIEVLFVTVLWPGSRQKYRTSCHDVLLLIPTEIICNWWCQETGWAQTQTTRALRDALRHFFWPLVSSEVNSSQDLLVLPISGAPLLEQASFLPPFPWAIPSTMVVGCSRDCYCPITGLDSKHNSTYWHGTLWLHTKIWNNIFAHVFA